MANRLLQVLSLLSPFLVLAGAAPIATIRPVVDENSLRQAITARSSSVVSLTKNIVLTANLPLIPNRKTLTVQSANISGSPFRIDGLNRYNIFRSTPGALVTLRLNNLVITRALFAAVDIDGALGSVLGVNKVTFSNSPRALNLSLVTATVSDSIFSRHTKTAVVVTSTQASADKVTLTRCNFASNQAAPGKDGGAINILFGDIVLNQCNFDRNNASNGGALTFNASSGELRGCSFTNNRAKFAGGAVMSYRDNFIVVNDGKFLSNVAEARGGGAVSVVNTGSFSLIFFTRTAFQRNTAKFAGGAFILENGGTMAFFCASTFWANTVNGVANNGYIRASPRLPNKNITMGGSARPALVNVERGANLEFFQSTC